MGDQRRVIVLGSTGSIGTQALDVIRKEYAELAAHSLTKDELESAKQQVRGSMVLALENPTSRMYRLASQALYGDRYRSIDEALTEIDAVTTQEVAAVAEEFFQPERQAIVWLGPN